MSDTDAEKGSARRHAEAYRKGYLAGRRGCTRTIPMSTTAEERGS